MFGPVVEGDDGILRPRIARVTLAFEPEPWLLRSLERFANPGDQWTKIGIVESRPESDQDYSPHREDGAEQALGVGIANHLIVGSMTKNDGIRIFPVPMQMDDRLVLSQENSLNLITFPPGDRVALHNLFDQVVVVGRRDRDAQSRDGFDHLAIARLERSDALA